MKTKSKIILALSVTCLTSVKISLAQLSLGANIASDKYSEESTSYSQYRLLGVAFFCEHPFLPKSGIRFGVQYSFPNKYDEQLVAYGPHCIQTTLDGHYVVRGYRILIDGKFYMFKGNYGNGGFYITTGFGLTSINTKFTIEDYELFKNCLGEEPYSRTKSRAYIRLHIGYDIKFSRAALFIEPGLDFSYTGDQDKTGTDALQTIGTINIGVWYPIGKSEVTTKTDPQ